MAIRKQKDSPKKDCPDGRQKGGVPPAHYTVYTHPIRQQCAIYCANVHLLYYIYAFLSIVIIDKSEYDFFYKCTISTELSQAKRSPHSGDLF